MLISSLVRWIVFLSNIRATVVHLYADRKWLIHDWDYAKWGFIMLIMIWRIPTQEASGWHHSWSWHDGHSVVLCSLFMFFFSRLFINSSTHHRKENMPFYSSFAVVISKIDSWFIDASFLQIRLFWDIYMHIYSHFPNFIFPTPLLSGVRTNRQVRLAAQVNLASKSEVTHRIEFRFINVSDFLILNHSPTLFILFARLPRGQNKPL